MSTAAFSRPLRSAPDRWDALLVCVGGLLVTSVGRIHMAVPGLDALRPTLVLGVVAVGLYALDPTPRRRIALALRGPVLPLLALVAWMALGLPTSLRGYRTLAFLLDDFLKTLLILLLVVGSVRGLRDVERLAWVYFASAAAYGVVVLTQFTLGAGAWRLANLLTYDANDFAVLAVTALPLGVHSLLRPGRSALWRLVDLGGIAVLSITFVWAGSRGGFLALLAAGGFFLIRYRGVGVGFKAATVGAVALVVAAVAGPRFWNQMQTMLAPETDYNVTASTGRLQIWKRGLGYMRDRPLLGVGAANFPVAEGTLSPLASMQEYGIGVRWTAAHNAYVQVGAEVGIPGLLFYLTFVVATFVTLARAGRGSGGRAPPERVRGLVDAITASLVGFLVGSFFLSLAYAAMGYVLAGLAAGLGKVTAAACARAGSGAGTGSSSGSASATGRNVNSATRRRSFGAAVSIPR